MATQTKKIPKGAKKKFFEVDIPLTATKVNLYSYTPEMLIGSMILLDLSKKLRGKNLELKAKVNLENGRLVGELVSLEINKQYIKKTIRKGTDYVEDSFETSCKDAKLRVKPFLITRKRVSRQIRKALRESARKFIEARTTTRTSEELFTELTTNKFQKEMSIKLKKIYPLALSEIRSIKILEKVEPKQKEKKAETAAPVEVSEQ
ncbi:hypothetical protein COU60_01465 [Candidatus Pacearchaeota archaeon CG10_big_fil_rev_8_21_14_0_10_34_76]|nr:MAG: hypothetical protein COU60_01465 [Candidatus Pacearchaeota archaeon CG10_big_fil_rev_8_21_14_0_10_34_76]